MILPDVRVKGGPRDGTSFVEIRSRSARDPKGLPSVSYPPSPPTVTLPRSPECHKGKGEAECVSVLWGLGRRGPGRLGSGPTCCGSVSRDILPFYETGLSHSWWGWRDGIPHDHGVGVFGLQSSQSSPFPYMERKLLVDDLTNLWNKWVSGRSIRGNKSKTFPPLTPNLSNPEQVPVSRPLSLRL